MSKATTNYGLVKPAPDDFYDIEVQNGNMQKVDEALDAKAPKDNPVFTGKMLIPQPSEIPEENEAATVKFVQENGDGAAAGVHISPETAETTGAAENNVESALSAVGGRLEGMETALPMPTETGQILLADLSDPERSKFKLASLSGAQAKPITGFTVEKAFYKTLGTLKVGDRVKFGMYNDEPIVWRIADKNHEGYPEGAVTLITDKIISLKCFDAAEPSNSDSNRRTYGNNRYIYSNIRQWLNSEAEAGKWYQAQ